MSWCTIESDPGVFNEMLWNIGAKNVAVQEIYSLDHIAQSEETSFGLIFLFKWVQEADSRPIAPEHETEGLIFAKQIATNACATQALLSVLLNAPNVELSDELSEFKSFVSILDPESRGMAIENADNIRNVHNSFARPEPFLNDEVKAENAEREDAHHFIAFIPYNGKVYELDGLKEGPIEVGVVSDGSNWLAAAGPVIEQRMARYAASETHFALLSVGARRRISLQEQIHLIQTQLDTMTTENSEVSAQLNERMQLLRLQLDEEILLEESQREENIRRRHNYVPFIVALLRQLAKRQQLMPMVEAAKARARTQATSSK